MHAAAVARVALDLAERVAAANADGRLALVLGGDCAVGIGTYLGVRRGHDEPWLLYLDPHPDLNTPQDNTSGSLSWMGNAHLLGRPGAVPQLAGLDDGPALAPERLILFDASPTRSQPAEREAIGIWQNRDPQFAVAVISAVARPSVKVFIVEPSAAP